MEFEGLYRYIKVSRLLFNWVCADCIPFSHPIFYSFPIPFKLPLTSQHPHFDVFLSANACDQQDWHGIFLRFDRDDSGTIDRKELHAALLGFGFSLPPEMVKRLEKRFAPPPQPGLEHQKKGISFDRFLLACVTVKHYTEAFRK